MAVIVGRSDRLPLAARFSPVGYFYVHPMREKDASAFGIDK
ncbi:hypothetical protein L810_6825 [Burkholderia sp. AU4i]|nr:hypothetical protein L810_6825 [Burkholderia sp. AU4i]